MADNGAAPQEFTQQGQPGTTQASGGRPSGFEVADKVAHGAGRVAHGIAWFLMKTWGLILTLGGIALLFADPGKYWWACAGIATYGVYLLLPGSKTVVW
ncbi:hypothetical protein [Demequina lutea]|uniref:Uncharacterized protein n=1 Tax=Demequina lutea TaxID=431489 RepID=A0A7Y9Z810_9MICO|nr:hypothetical protein [Demequina lutea]NYI39920.1 hypothetical protein [Demequina lutea]